MLVQQWQGEERQRKRARLSPSLLSDNRRRAVNREFVLVLEQQLLAVSLSIMDFMAKPVLSRLHPLMTIDIDQRQHVVSLKDAKGVELSKFDASAESWSKRKILFTVLDQGPKTWPSMSFLCWYGMRIQAGADLLHRLVNDYGLSTTHSRLSALRMQFKVVLSVRNGPFRSGAHHNLLSQSATIMKQTSAYRQALWQHMYPHVAHEHAMDADPGFGTPEHEKTVFMHVVKIFEGASKGKEVKASRWWSQEANGCILVRDVGLVTFLYLLVRLGWHKQWWRTWDRCPLSLSDTAKQMPSNDVSEPTMEGDEDEAVEELGEQSATQADKDKDKGKGRQARHTNRVALSAQILARPLRRVFVGMVHLPSICEEVFRGEDGAGEDSVGISHSCSGPLRR